MQGYYPNLKQNLAEKETFVISKVNGSQPLFIECCLSSQVPKSDNCMLSREQRSNQERLQDDSREALEAIFQVMRVVVKHREGQKHLKKTVLYPKSTLAGPSLHDQA